MPKYEDRIASRRKVGMRSSYLSLFISFFGFFFSTKKGGRFFILVLTSAIFPCLGPFCFAVCPSPHSFGRVRLNLFGVPASIWGRASFTACFLAGDVQTFHGEEIVHRIASRQGSHLATLDHEGELGGELSSFSPRLLLLFAFVRIIFSGGRGQLPRSAALLRPKPFFSVFLCPPVFRGSGTTPGDRSLRIES